MNRVNPLHIGALLIVILLFVLFKLHSAKSELLEAKKSFNETSQIAVKLNGLKKVYANTTESKRVLLKILSISKLQSLEMDKKIEKSYAKIAIKSIDKMALNILMGKVLNSTLIIKKLKIKRLSEKKASLEMEITW